MMLQLGQELHARYNLADMLVKSLCSPLLIALLAVVCAGDSLAQPKKISGTRQYMYLSDQRILTLEIVNSEKIILNYINLGQAYDLVEATMVVLLDEFGASYRGQVIAIEPVTDPAERYRVSELLSPKKFKGFTILGNFRMEAPAKSAYFKTGGRVIELEPLTAEDFEKAAEMVAGIELTTDDPKYALQRAGFRRGYGKIFFAGSAEANDLEKWFEQADVLAPIPVYRPAPKLPAKFADLPDPVVVELKLLVSKSGGLYQFQVTKSPNPAVGELAMETVKNSWRFLPAISKGQVSDASLTLRVTFER
ncbi:MAG: energy transducer TonB [Acidobacteria bacterium]|nr:MAG: energy transducer TonB [Acidobacteriota bacterium]